MVKVKKSGLKSIKGETPAKVKQTQMKKSLKGSGAMIRNSVMLPTVTQNVSQRSVNLEAVEVNKKLKTVQNNVKGPPQKKQIESVQGVGTKTGKNLASTSVTNTKDVKNLKGGEVNKKLKAVHNYVKSVPQKKQAEAVVEGKVPKIEKTLLLPSVTKNKGVKNPKVKDGDLNKKSKNIASEIKAKEIVAELDEQAEKIPKNSSAKVANTGKDPNGNIKKVRNPILANLKKDAKYIKIAPTDSFDEEKFKAILCAKNIGKISETLKVLVEQQVSKNKTSIFDDYRYYLHVTSFKIPNCPKRIVKLNLKHSLVDTAKDDVVMIVTDLQRGAKVDVEPTVQHYEDILREIGEDNIKVTSFNQLRKECSSFEAKKKFVNSYDYLLCDGRIVGHVVGFCGKACQKPRTTLHAVHLENPAKYKSAIEHALKRTSFRQLQKGDLISIPVGNHRFTTNQLVENIELVIHQLKTIFPGSYANIRNIHIRIDIKGTSALPLYVNLADPPAEVPNVFGPREQQMIKLKKQANNILSNFSMSKTGEFVKLNKAEVRRKREIHEARKALLEDEKSEDDEPNIPLRKKIKSDSPMNTDDDETEESNNFANREDTDVSSEEY